MPCNALMREQRLPHLSLAGTCLIQCHEATVHFLDKRPKFRSPASPAAARAASGHAAANPPSAASNSRRPMVTVIRPSRARCVKGTIPRHELAVPNDAALVAGEAHAGHRLATERSPRATLWLRRRWRGSVGISQ